MIVAYSSELNISLVAAKIAVIKTYPESNEDVMAIQNKIDLDTYLIDRGFVVYVDIDPTLEQNVFLAEEARVQAEVDARMADGYCESPLPELEFEPDDLVDYCEVFDEGIDPTEQISLAAFEAEIASIIKAQDGGLSDGLGIDDLDPGSPIGKAMACMKEIQKITDELAILANKEKFIKETVVNFEQLLYNYRAMEEYYKTKRDTLDALTNQFTVLLREKRHIDEVDIPEIQSRKTALTSTRDAYIANLTPGTTRPTTTEDQYNAELAAFDVEFTKLQDRKIAIQEAVQANKDNTYAFDFVELQDDTIANRRSSLQSSLQSVANTGTLGNFSTNVELDSASGSIEDGFKLKLRHETKDQVGILAGKDLGFTKTAGVVKIEPYTGSDPGGVLYTSLYNIWGDIEKFFTRDERGLSTDKNQMDPTLQNTGAQAINGNYIQSLSKFEDFYTNFDTYHKAKAESVKTNVIEPALRAGQLAMRDSARKEVQLLLSFGKVFEVLPEDEDTAGNGARLNGLINTIRSSSGEYIDKLDACRAIYNFTKSKHDEILAAIEKKKLEYSQVSCVGAAEPGEPKKAPGSDPLGKTTMGKEDPNDPNFTKFCYWKRFATYATAVNLLPLPGNGGLKYWPVGLTIPNPSGLTKIPLPIIWIPLTVIALPMGVFVMFIGQCGICPSPFLLYIGASGEKKFTVSLRPTDQFGADAGSGNFKLASKGGIALTAKVNDLVAGLPIVPGFPKIDIPGLLNLSPDSNATIISDTKKDILRKINKLSLPKVDKLNNLNPNARPDEKKAAFKEVVTDWLGVLKIPSKKFPKNAKGVNPKPSPMAEMIDQLKAMIDMDLPNMLPPADKIDVKAKLVEKIRGLKVPEINLPDRLKNGVTVPSIKDPAKVDAFVADIKEVMSKIVAASVDKITPKQVGIAAALSTPPVFLNPYQCKQSSGGFKLPNIGPFTGAIVAIKAAALGVVSSLNGKVITDNFIGGQNIAPPPVTPEAIIAFMTKIADVSVPNVSIPNVSNVSIKDMLQTSIKSATSTALPSIPAPGGIKPRVSIPGSLLKNALIPAVSNTIDASLDPLSLPPLPSISAIDVKQIAIDFIEQSFGPVETAMEPVLKAISIVSGLKSQDKSFGEMLGLSKVTLDPLKIEVAPELALLAATKVLAKLPAPPYPAVAVAPTAFKLIHPILSQDDLPPWDRLSLSNPLFVVFLDQFCTQGKKGGGLFENP